MSTEVTEATQRTQSGLPIGFPPALNILSRQVIGAAMQVHTHLGPALRERIYERALVTELRGAGMIVEQQVPVLAAYKGADLPVQAINMIVERALVLTIRSVRVLTDTDHAELIGHLTFSRLPLGLLMNFACPHLRDGIYRKINFPPHSSPFVEIKPFAPISEPSSSVTSV